MSRLCRLQRDFDRFPVAHLPNENNLGRLPQGRAKRQRKHRRVAVQLPLMNCCFLVVMEKFDGVLDRQDVNRALFIHAIHDGRQRGGLAGAGRPRDQSNAITEMNDLVQLGRKLQTLKRRNGAGNHPHYARIASPLPEDIHPESRGVGD